MDRNFFFIKLLLSLSSEAQEVGFLAISSQREKGKILSIDNLTRSSEQTPAAIICGETKLFVENKIPDCLVVFSWP